MVEGLDPAGNNISTSNLTTKITTTASHWNDTF